MQYLGGKSRTARQIAGYLNAMRRPGQPYWEPFVGAGWILERIRGAGQNYASDLNQYLIAMWRALQAGWQPPEVVTEEEYRAIAAAPESYPPELVAFVGFGCSFAGKWFAGYARRKRWINYAGSAKRSLARKAGNLPEVAFYRANFLTAEPPAADCLIYCDPPYANTTGYGAVAPWDPAAFWDRVKLLERRGHVVIVSEYRAPSGFDCILEIPTKTEIRTPENGRELRIERLFRLGQHAWPLQPGLFRAGVGG